MHTKEAFACMLYVRLAQQQHQGLAVRLSAKSGRSTSPAMIRTCISDINALLVTASICLVSIHSFPTLRGLPRLRNRWTASACC